MKLAISDIAWGQELDEAVYEHMLSQGVTGLEIAPTRWLSSKHPYEETKRAGVEAKKLKERGISLVSMQSLWYGKTGRIAESREKYLELLDYTKQAIDFAKEISCKNLVFGNPTARTVEQEEDLKLLHDFFEEAGAYAAAAGVVIAMEANPAIYHTNFLTTTREALDFVKQLSSPGCKINLDLGTILCNQEEISWLLKERDWIHHVHISEPHLAVIKKRGLHRELAGLLTQMEYVGAVSIEMKSGASREEIFQAMDYVAEVFSNGKIC